MSNHTTAITVRLSVVTNGGVVIVKTPRTRGHRVFQGTARATARVSAAWITNRAASAASLRAANTRTTIALIVTNTGAARSRNAALELLKGQMRNAMRTCDAAVQVLRETDNPAVMWGDEGLLHLIANRAGLKVSGRAWRTSEAVLNNLAKCSGVLVPKMTRCRSGGRERWVRIFYLPEHA